MTKCKLYFLLHALHTNSVSKIEFFQLIADEGTILRTYRSSTEGCIHVLEKTTFQLCLRMKCSKTVRCEPTLTTGVDVEGVMELEDARNKGVFKSDCVKLGESHCETRVQRTRCDFISFEEGEVTCENGDSAL